MTGENNILYSVTGLMRTPKPIGQDLRPKHLSPKPNTQHRLYQFQRKKNVPNIPTYLHG